MIEFSIQVDERIFFTLGFIIVIFITAKFSFLCFYSKYTTKGG